MSRTIVSTSQLCLSRQQQEFLSKYRTASARQAYLDSYGEGESNFLDSLPSRDIIKPSVPDVVLPYDFEVEYISVSKESLYPFIDTGVILSIQDGYILDFLFEIDSLSSIYNMSLTSDVYTNSPSIAVYFDGDYFFLQNLAGNRIGFVASPFVVHRFVFNGYTGVCSVDDDSRRTTFDKNLVNDKTLKIFNDHPNTFCTGKFYNLKIYESDVLTHDFIPVSKDGIGFVFDKVSSELLSNAGSGDFLVGPRKV